MRCFSGPTGSDGMCGAAEGGSAGAAADEIISKAMGSKDTAEEEPLVSEGEPAAVDPLIPGTGVPILRGTEPSCWAFKSLFVSSLRRGRDTYGSRVPTLCRHSNGCIPRVSIQDGREPIDSGRLPILSLDVIVKSCMLM